MPDAVVTTGLRQVRRGLGVIDKQLPKDLRAALKTRVAEPIAAAARPKVPVRSGRAQRSVRAGATAKGADVRGGGARAVHFGWLDFGGTIRHHGPNHTHKAGVNHLIKREVKKEGRYLFPTAKERRPQIEAAGQRVIEDVLRKAGL